MGGVGLRSIISPMSVSRMGKAIMLIFADAPSQWCLKQQRIGQSYTNRARTSNPIDCSRIQKDEHSQLGMPSTKSGDSNYSAGLKSLFNNTT